jgi:ligand-binding sensor domain-containing protein
MSVVIRLSSLSILSLILLGGATTAAQYRFESWTADDGLPQNSVRSTIQTRDGYLRLTTFDGLMRFDGARFPPFGCGTSASRVLSACFVAQCQAVSTLELSHRPPSKPSKFSMRGTLIRGRLE